MRTATLIAASVLGAISFGCESGPPREEASPPSSVDVTEQRLPPLLDPQSLADAEPPGVPLPQLVGLRLADAQAWADQSGFELVLAEDAHEGAFVPTARIVVGVVDGVVTTASAG